MDFFNKIGDLANKAGKKTGDLTKEAKTKMKMNECKSKIEDLYKEIGKVAYQKHIDTAEFKKEDISDLCNNIDELTREIEEYQNEIRKLKNIKVCENCYTEINIDVRYCPHCGCEQPIEPEIVEKEEATQNVEENIEQSEEQKQEDNSDNKEE